MLALVGTMMDYMLSKRVMSWKEAWEIYGVENGGALFRDLARYGIRPPKGWDLASEVSEHGTHQFMLALYQWSFGTAFHAWIPNEQDMDRSEEHTSELQSLMRISYAVFCLKKKNNNKSIIYKES